MNIMVTGGCGFIGSNFINLIANKPEVNHIINIDLMTYAADKNNVEANEKIKHFDINITDSTAMAAFLVNYNITHIVHFAAESHVDNSIKSPKEFIRTNVVGTFSLLEAARFHKNLKRFHHVSTDEVYGSLGEFGYFSETTPYDPRSPYSASKASSDHLVNAYHHTYKLPTTISNCSNNYGPCQHKEKLIPKIIQNIKKGIKVPVYGNGQNIRDWLYVSDHCEAIWEILLNGLEGNTYNVGGDCERNNIQILTEICNLMEVNVSDVIEFVEDRKGHDFRYAIDFSKIKNELGWTPKTNFIEGLKKTIEFYTIEK